MSSQTAEYTPDEILINRAGQELQLMIETSPYSPIECLRRVFVPLLEQIRADIKATGLQVPKAVPLNLIRDTIRLAIAESDCDFKLPDGDLSNSDIDRLADIAAAAIEEDLPHSRALVEILATARTSLKPDIYPDEESWLRAKLRDIERLVVKAMA